MRFRLISENRHLNLRQRVWSKNGALNERAPELVLMERDGERHWRASRGGTAWGDGYRTGMSCAEALRATAADLLAMAEEIEKRDRLDAKARG